MHKSWLWLQICRFSNYPPYLFFSLLFKNIANGLIVGDILIYIVLYFYAKLAWLTHCACARCACYGGHRQLRLWSCSTQALGFTPAYAFGTVTPFRQGSSPSRSGFTHPSALLDYCGLATLNGLARNGRSLRSTPRKIRSSSLAKLTLSSLDSRIPFRRLKQIRLKHRNQRIVLVLLLLKTNQKPNINLPCRHLPKKVCD